MLTCLMSVFLHTFPGIFFSVTTTLKSQGIGVFGSKEALMTYFFNTPKCVDNRSRYAKGIDCSHCITDLIWSLIVKLTSVLSNFPIPENSTSLSEIICGVIHGMWVLSEVVASTGLVWSIPNAFESSKSNNNST